MASGKLEGCEKIGDERSVSYTFEPIGWVRSPFTDTAQVPKGLGAQHRAEGVLEIDARFESGLADIEGFSHLVVLWVFDRVQGVELTAWPPSDDRPHGVFATRSPQRPNPIGLTVVELLGRDGRTLRVAGIDMLDGTPILDIKPYLSNVAAATLRRGWLAEAEARGAQRMESRKTASQHADGEEADRNLLSISPFFIVQDLRASVRYYVERLGFELDFQGPPDDPYYAGVKRDGLGIMLKAIVPDVAPRPNHTRHEWARWDAYIYTRDPDRLFEEFSRRGVSFVKELSFIDDGLWGFEIADGDGYVLAFFHLRDGQATV